MTLNNPQGIGRKTRNQCQPCVDDEVMDTWELTVLVSMYMSENVHNKELLRAMGVAQW